jgi:DNA repair protein RadC
MKNQLSYLTVEQQPEWRPKVRDLPARERPVNRLREVGPRAISTAEVLACLLQTSDALSQAQELLARFEGLLGLARASEAEIVQVAGIGPAQAARIRAAMEFGRRLVAYVPDARPQVRSPTDAAQLLMAEMSLLEQEHLRLILLDTKNHVLSIPTVYVGSLNTSIIRTGELFRYALKENCAALIVVHNHPSGDPTPSPEDVTVTRKLVEGGQLLDVEVLDHLVIGQGRFVSLKERGLGF